MTITKDVGFYLRVYRAVHDLTIRQAAADFGLSVSYWSLLEAGKRTPSPHVAKLLADRTGAPFELVMGVAPPATGDAAAIIREIVTREL